MAHVEIYTDGSCKGNGRADGGRGGWAAILSCNVKTKEVSAAACASVSARSLPGPSRCSLGLLHFSIME